MHLHTEPKGGTTGLEAPLSVWPSSLSRVRVLEAHPEMIKPDDNFDNLPAYLPGGRRRDVLLRYTDDAAHADTIPAEQCWQHSAVWLRQTPREFIAAIDAALETLGVGPDIIKSRILHCHSRPATQTDREALAREVLIPLYLMLRAAGYTHYELTG